MTTATVIDQLQHDWDNTFDHRPNPWSARPELNQFDTLGDITVHLTRCDSETANAIGWALMNAYWDGDEDAARTLLHAMLPRVKRLTRTALGRGYTEPAEAVVASLWSVIATYPRHRRNVITTLAMDTLNRMGNADMAGRRWSRQDPAEQALDSDMFDFLLPEAVQSEWAQDATSRTEQAASEATALLAWAQREQVISGPAVQLLARIHLADDSPSLAQVAAELGISEPAARKRHSVAVQRLAAAVRERLGL